MRLRAESKKPWKERRVRINGNTQPGQLEGLSQLRRPAASESHPHRHGAMRPEQHSGVSSGWDVRSLRSQLGSAGGGGQGDAPRGRHPAPDRGQSMAGAARRAVAAAAQRGHPRRRGPQGRAENLPPGRRSSPARPAAALRRCSRRRRLRVGLAHTDSDLPGRLLPQARRGPGRAHASVLADACATKQRHPGSLELSHGGNEVSR